MYHSVRQLQIRKPEIIKSKVTQPPQIHSFKLSIELSHPSMRYTVCYIKLPFLSLVDGFNRYLGVQIIVFFKLMNKGFYTCRNISLILSDGEIHSYKSIIFPSLLLNIFFQGYKESWLNIFIKNNS